MATRKSKKTTSKSTPVWDRPPPAKAKHTHLSAERKQAARARAKRAGRPYPNLVDNMRAAKKSTLSAKGGRKARKKT